ncbi:antitermination factor NusG [Pedobacter cryoconitis]|uniref:Antitermination factor NusG n=1 Tax=Pedobacter cryoconitis TaxID=188932 RepID=A0A127VFP6_9SPHI|nr:UpxY family transcription antiterminator [Pedobacter cryoconitis]AMP99738.1 antitermination factor NusG [Pedobacter cryoconitis]
MSKLIPGWHVIYTRPKHEKRIHNRLAEVNIKSFFPTVKKLKVWSDRRKYIDVPLFPSYLFIYLDGMNSYFQTLDTEGCLYYIKTDNIVSRVSDSVMNNIMLATKESVDVEVSDNRISVGKQLVIKGGALTGLQCELVEYYNHKKLLVRVDLLNRNILVPVPKENLMLL